jgi:hypothetical protein
MTAAAKLRPEALVHVESLPAGRPPTAG